MSMSFVCKKSLYHVKKSYRLTAFTVGLEVENTNFNSSILSSAKHVLGMNPPCSEVLLFKTQAIFKQRKSTRFMSNLDDDKTLQLRYNMSSAMKVHLNRQTRCLINDAAITSLIRTCDLNVWWNYTCKYILL